MIIDGHHHVEAGYEGILARMDELGIGKTVLIGVGVRDLSVITIRDSIVFRHDILLKILGNWKARRLLRSPALKAVLMRQPVNDRVLCAIKEKPDRFYGFSFIHPGSEAVMAELDRCLAGGMRGIKLALLQYPTDLSGQRMFDICELAAAKKVPVFFHQGLTRASSDARKMIRSFPSVKFIIAHAGVQYFRDAVELAMTMDNVFVDTSSYFVTVAKLRYLCRKVGPRKLVFGSDVPVMSRDPSEGLAKIRALGLRREDEDRILGENLLEIIERN